MLMRPDVPPVVQPAAWLHARVCLRRRSLWAPTEPFLPHRSGLWLPLQAATLIAHTAKAASAGGFGVTTDAIDTTGVNLLVAAVCDYAPGDRSLTDSKGNTWQALTLYQNVASVTSVQLYYVISPTVGSGHTFSLDGNSYPTLHVQAWTVTGPAYDSRENGSSSTTPSTTRQPGSVTPSEDGCLIVSAISFNTVLNVASINNSFTISDQLAATAGANVGGAFAYLLQSTAAAINPTWTLTISDESSAAIAVFKAGATGGGVSIDSVTPGTFEDAETGIVIAGDNF